MVSLAVVNPQRHCPPPLPPPLHCIQKRSVAFSTYLLQEPQLLVRLVRRVARKLLQRQRVVVRRLEVLRLQRRRLLRDTCV